jgi:hypothetical protein
MSNDYTPDKNPVPVFRFPESSTEQPKDAAKTIANIQAHIASLPTYSCDAKLYIRTDRYIDALKMIIEGQEHEITQLKKKLKKK